jgi:hypothetical protein
MTIKGMLSPSDRGMVELTAEVCREGLMLEVEPPRVLLVLRARHASHYRRYYRRALGWFTEYLMNGMIWYDMV